jgi:hypothetical protein
LVSTALVAQVLQNNTIYSKNDVTEQWMHSLKNNLQNNN